jgi:hypothetical protein
MQTCSKCGEYKSDAELSWCWRALNIRQKVCKQGRKIENAQWYERHGPEYRQKVMVNTANKRKKSRSFIRSLLTRNKCKDCGETDPNVLEFDHVTGKKFKDISKMVAQGYSIAAIEKEVMKIEIACANSTGGPRQGSAKSEAAGRRGRPYLAFCDISRRMQRTYQSNLPLENQESNCANLRRLQ